METNQGSAAVFKNMAFERILNAVLISTVFFSGLLHAAPIAVEKIFVADFEEQSVEVYPRIEFVGDRAQLFSGSGEDCTATVRVYDVNGNLIDDPDIDWTAGDGALLSVSATAPCQAQLSSLGAWDGTVTYGPHTRRWA